MNALMIPTARRSNVHANGTDTAALLGQLVAEQTQTRRLLRVVLKRLRARERQQQDSPRLAQRPDCRHSQDFRSVVWQGASYSLTALQAAVVAILWRGWEKGTPDVGQETLLQAVGSEDRRLDSLFKRSPAFGKMIVQGDTKGTFRLSDPVPDQQEQAA